MRLDIGQTSAFLDRHDVATADVKLSGELYLGHCAFQGANLTHIGSIELGSAQMSGSMFALRKRLKMVQANAGFGSAEVMHIGSGSHGAMGCDVDLSMNPSSASGDRVRIALSLPDVARRLVTAVFFVPGFGKSDACVPTNEAHMLSFDLLALGVGIASKARSLAAAAFTQSVFTHRSIIRGGG